MTWPDRVAAPEIRGGLDTSGGRLGHGNVFVRLPGADPNRGALRVHRPVFGNPGWGE
ncbi:hypothetical protein [Actinoalloteichus fjordicus]|uniref:Uncharacterized protein n=2 Tax=Actinoalloteichus TaxID=65496 RepID=A0AAC9LAN3_9PSEU|nr:hypothetical protein [Actinoalloteichus fjordicus]APU12910.1 hypothetical protein UA74_04155 [Actinoalloteichus fjordicus]